MKARTLHTDEICGRIDREYAAMTTKYAIKKESRVGFWRWVLRKVFRI